MVQEKKLPRGGKEEKMKDALSRLKKNGKSNLYTLSLNIVFFYMQTCRQKSNCFDHNHDNLVFNFI